MLGNDLYQIIQWDTRLSIHFKGVYAANELPKWLPVRGIAIVNCCNRNRPGEHWIALCQESESKLEMFDSYGYGPTNLKQIKTSGQTDDFDIFSYKRI